MLVELLDGGGVDVLEEVGAAEDGGLGGLLDPEVLWRLEVVTEDGYDLLDLVIAVLVDEEVKLLVEVQRALGGSRVLPLHGLDQVLILLQGLLQDLLIELVLLVVLAEVVRCLRYAGLVEGGFGFEGVGPLLLVILCLVDLPEVESKLLVASEDVVRVARELAVAVGVFTDLSGA